MQTRKSMDMETILQRKVFQYEELDRSLADLKAENAALLKRIAVLELERAKQGEVIAELRHLSEKSRDTVSKNKKMCDSLSRGIQLAKEIMTGLLAVKVQFLCDIEQINRLLLNFI